MSRTIMRPGSPAIRVIMRFRGVNATFGMIGSMGVIKCSMISPIPPIMAFATRFFIIL